MIIRNVRTLLENLTELERDIQVVERMLEDLGIEVDRENILRALVKRKRDESLSRNQRKN